MKLTSYAVILSSVDQCNSRIVRHWDSLLEDLLSELKLLVPKLLIFYVKSAITKNISISQNDIEYLKE